MKDESEYKLVPLSKLKNDDKIKVLKDPEGDTLTAKIVQKFTPWKHEKVQIDLKIATGFDEPPRQGYVYTLNVRGPATK